MCVSSGRGRANISNAFFYDVCWFLRGAFQRANNEHTSHAHTRILIWRHGGYCRRRYSPTHPRSLKMRSTMKKMTCRALVVSLLALSFQTANAGLIGADQAAAVGAAQTDRGMVMAA